MHSSFSSNDDNVANCKHRKFYANNCTHTQSCEKRQSNGTLKPTNERIHTREEGEERKWKNGESISRSSRQQFKLSLFTLAQVFLYNTILPRTHTHTHIIYIQKQLWIKYNLLYGERELVVGSCFLRHIYMWRTTHKNSSHCSNDWVRENIYQHDIWKRSEMWRGRVRHA